MTAFADYQRRMWTTISYFSVCRFYIERDPKGNYVIKKVGLFRLLVYYSLWVNSLIKITYLVLTYQGFLVEVHFLDQMSMWDWFLCFSQLVQEANMWCRKYPLFEVLHANWKIQEDVFRKLGSPEHVQQRILKNDKALVKMHLVIITVGCSAIGIQAASSAKYALNTYAIIPYDNWILQVFFCVHEIVYIFHIWAHQASSIVLCEVFACSYTHIIREMRIVLERLIQEGKTVRAGFKHKYSKEIVARYMDPSIIVRGTHYNMQTLIEDYRKMMLATTSFNKWVGLLQGGTTGSNYGQFVSDVFMMIQLLKEPETDLMAVAFFMEDACAGMIMLFRQLIIMSRLYPASEEFLQTFKVYLMHDMPNKRYWRKYQRNLRIIAAKLGGYSTKPITVPKGINALMGWYINAAMWQRPTDRIT